VRLRRQEAEDFFFISVAKQLVRLVKKNSLFISNHDGYFDGAGAQTQRILSVYCFANFLETPFLLKPIQRIELQPIDLIDSEAGLLQEIASLNGWLARILVQGMPPSEFRIVRVERLIYLPWHLLQAAFFSRFSNKVTRLSLLDGYSACRSRPEIWNFLPNLPNQQTNNSKLQIHVHLRLTNFVPHKDRSVKLSFYTDLLQHIQRTFENRANNSSIIIHTDMFGKIIEKNLLLKYAVPESIKYWKELQILDNDCNVLSKSVSNAIEKLQKILGEIPNCEIHRPQSWTSEWESMAMGDLLLLGKSSYSAVGGLFNNTGLVVGPNFWSSGKSNWCTSDDLEFIKDWISEHF
jgi:hypothetical protein